MNIFFYVAGIVATISGVIAIAVVTGVYIAVKFFGIFITLGYIKDDEQGNQRDD